MDGWDPLVVLLARGLGYLILIAAFFGLLYITVKYAVRDGINLAGDDVRAITKESDGRE